MPSVSRVTPFTSIKAGRVPLPFISLRVNARSNRESPWVTSRCRLSGAQPGSPGMLSCASSHSQAARLGAWESMLIRMPPLYTPIRSYSVLRPAAAASGWYSRITFTPGINSSLHRPVFFTWQTTVCPSSFTWAMKRLGRLMKVPFFICW